MKPSHVNETHHFFSAANKILGVSYMTNLWKKSQRQIYNWGADPDFCEVNGRNPLDLFRITCSRLQELGRDDVVEGALRLLLKPLGYDFRREDYCTDKQSTVMEMLDVNQAIGNLAKVVQEILEDGIIEPHEKLMVAEAVSTLVQQAMELQDAVEKEMV